MHLDELKEQVAAQLSCEQILDLLGWTTYELVDALQLYIMDEHDVFEDALDN